MSDLLYLYGFVGADAAAPPALAGIGESAVRLVPEGDIAAVVSTVPADAYEVARIEARMDDLDWVGTQGLAHERVVSWFVDHGDIVPVPLFTLYTGPAALETELRARGGEVRRHLERLRGRREWDLKLAYDAEKLGASIASASAEVRALDNELAAATPGRKFLLERKRHELARSEVRRVATDRSDALLAALEAHADDAVRLPLDRAGGALPVLLHAALLVPRDAETAFARTLAERMQELEPLGFAASLTGPWAPYRFVEVAT